MPSLSLGQITTQLNRTRSSPMGEGGTLTTATIGSTDYNYHFFGTSGYFTATSAGYYEIVAVAGGGGGGMDNGGGGGAGELIHAPSYYLNAGTYSITVGAGGAGAPTSAGSSTGNPGSQGNPTVIENVFTAREGGGGASGQGTTVSRQGGRNGGSGGGGQGENYALYFIYGGLGYGSLADHQVSYNFTPAVSHYLTVTGNSVFDYGTDTDFTLSCWINQHNDWTTVPASGYVFSAGSGTSIYALNYTATTYGITGLTFNVTTASGTTSVLSSTKGLAYRSWNHIAITRSGTTYRLYLNGVLEDEQVIEALSVDAGSANINIGNTFEGTIKDLHFISGEALYVDASFSVPHYYPTATANTVLLCLLDPTTDEYSQYSHTITPSSSIRPSITAFNDRYRGSPYSFPYNKTTFGGAIEWANASYMRADGAFSTFAAGDSWTIECHAMSGTAFTADNYLFGINTISAGANVMLLGHDRVFDGSTTHTFTNYVRPNKWQHYAVTYDGATSTVRVYIDGVLETSFTDSFSSLSTCVLGIGTEFDAANGGTPGNYWYGKMRNIRVTRGTALYTDSSFTPPLVTEDLPELEGTTLLITASSGVIEDASSANTTVTTYGGNIKAGYNYVLATEHQSYKFSSSYNDYFRADDALLALTNTTDPWTVEAFVQSDTYFKYLDSTDGFIFAFNTKASGANNLLLNGVRIVSSPSGTDVTTYGFTQALDQHWCHLAYSYEGTTLRMFIDGVKVFENDIPLGAALSDCVFGIATEFDAANGGTPGNYWYGRMRDLRFTSGVCLYRNNFNAPDPINDTLPVLSSTSLLMFRDGVPEDVSGNNVTITSRSTNMITDCFGQYYVRRHQGNYFRYGNDGGMAGPAGDDGGGGGGGAGREGRRAGSTTGGPGGDGVYINGFDNFGETGYFAGGGGGANNNSGSTAVIQGGLGGGGNGGVTGTVGSANTGGGGGASRINIAGRAGGSGAVIIRYPTN